MELDANSSSSLNHAAHVDILDTDAGVRLCCHATVPFFHICGHLGCGDSYCVCNYPYPSQ